jgi:hypothetical protein
MLVSLTGDHGQPPRPLRPVGADGPPDAGTAPAATKAFQTSVRKYFLVIASWIRASGLPRTTIHSSRLSIP